MSARLTARRSPAPAPSERRAGSVASRRLSAADVEQVLRRLPGLLAPRLPQLALATGVWVGDGPLDTPALPAQPAGAGTGRARPGSAGPATADPSAARLPDTGTPELADDVPVAVLVERAQAGEGEAFGLLYDRYVDAVFRFLVVRVGSVALAEDLTSETFLRALRHIQGFTWQGRDIGAWFVTIARNLVADHFKSSRARLELSLPDVREAAQEPGVAGPEQVVLTADDAQRVMAAVRQLVGDQQEVIQLRFFEELPVCDVARVMGRSEGAIKALQHRAVRALGRLLEGEAW